MKKLFSVILSAVLVLSFSACSNWSVEVKEPENSASLESNPTENLPEEIVTPTDKNAGITDGLIEEIVLNFGAEKVEQPDGSFALEPRVLSLYYYFQSGSLIASKMTPGDYFTWQHGYAMSFMSDYPSWEDFAAKYSHPDGKTQGYFFPQEEYEANVMKFFDVDVELLRSDPQFYDAEYEGYRIDYGGGIGDTPTITITGYVQDGDYITIGLELKSETQGNSSMLLTVRTYDGGYKYVDYLFGTLPDPDEYSLYDEEFEQKALDMGFSLEYLDFVRYYRWEISANDLLNNDSEGVKDVMSEYEREQSVIDSWLGLSSEAAADKAQRKVASSADGTKKVYLFYDDEAYYTPSYLIWYNDETGESRLLSIFSEHTAVNSGDDALLVYDMHTIKAFDLNTAEQLQNYGPQFDFGRFLYYQPEHVILGIGYDSEMKVYVVGYADWFSQNEEENTWEIKLAVFDNNGIPTRTLDTGVVVPVSVKSFFLYPDKISFPEKGRVKIRFYDYGTVDCSYL